jgi:hypothetical protein
VRATMGSEFVFSTCPMPPALTSDLKEEIQKRINSFTLAEVVSFLDRYHYNYEEEVQLRINSFNALSEDDLFEIDHLEEKYMREIVREMINDAVKEIASKQTTRRDIGILILDGKRYAISGGMTWGDNPTEAMTYIDMLADSRVLDGLNLEC